MASTIKSDIIISIRQPHLDHIVSLRKNHEFRGYLLPKQVTRFWIYEPSPVSAIKYIAEVSNGKRPGEVVDGGFIRNADFNEGKITDGNFAYEILKLEALDVPITLSQLKAKGWLLGAPQKYCYVKEVMALDLRGMKTTPISAHSLPIWPSDSTEQVKSVSEPGTQDIRSFLQKQPRSTAKPSTTLSGGIHKSGKGK
ncbi:hypothetical protein V8E51_009627 [Hyaloscypha variabilis]|uniref:Uncharacterized protein n=1 Tax=Hyaloscypha variabilis (strain UAMH 11265 / GT02V1 / F) TaxID=1149755 RepID=A0A2J6S5B0_HYAVF|nr:hypothetical protein L207DRAFT_450160 [Hyaloscypha variabilis F]